MLASGTITLARNCKRTQMWPQGRLFNRPDKVKMLKNNKELSDRTWVKKAWKASQLRSCGDLERKLHPTSWNKPSRVSADGPKNYMPDRQITRCERRGHHQKHNWQTCPANDARSHNCSKQGHFAKCCHAISRVSIVSEVELAETQRQRTQAVDSWHHSQDCVTFKLDSGADVTVLPPSTYNKLTNKPLLSKTQKKLYGPCRYDLRCRGEFQAMLKYWPNTWKTTFYALDDLNGPLLGRIACQKLGVAPKVDEIASPERTPWSHEEDTPKSIHWTGLYARRIWD